MPYENIFITGSNKGIGLEFVKQLAELQTTKRIIAHCRYEIRSSELRRLARANAKIKIVDLELSEFQKYPKFIEEVETHIGPEGLDLMINNAAVHHQGEFVNFNVEEMKDSYAVNVIAPLQLTRYLAKHLRASAKAGRKTFVANISSKLASIANNTRGEMYAYRPTKTALSQISKNLSLTFKDDSIIVASVATGWVRTDMGGPAAPLSPKESVEHMLRLFEDIKPEQSGLLLNYDGTVMLY